MPKNKTFYIKLDEAIKESRRQLTPFRAFRNEAIKQYVGHRFTENGTEFPVVNPLMSRFIQTHLRLLTARRPKALVTTKYKQLKPAAKDLSISLDNLATDIRLGETISKTVMDALFSLGIVKVGLNPAGTIEIYGEEFDVTSPFCMPISLDDFYMDMSARELDDVMFIGHEYWMDIDQMKKSGLFKKIGDISDESASMSHVNETGEERAQAIVTGPDVVGHALTDKVKLRDTYIPEYNLLVTTMVHGPSVQPIREVEWSGPSSSTGPFLMLGFGPVPETPMHLGPASRLMPSHLAANSVRRKQLDKAGRSKTIGVARGDKEFGNKVIGTSDGGVMYDNSNGTFEEFTTGGIDPRLHAYDVYLNEDFSKNAGNLDLLTGAAAQSGTLGQDRLLQNSSSQMLDDMRDNLTYFVEKIYNHLAWYKLEDPFTNDFIEKRVPGTNITVQKWFKPTDEERDILAYDVTITPYSEQPHTPGERLSFLMQFFQGVIVPSLPIIEAQGGQFNAPKFFDSISDYSGIEDVSDLITFASGSQAGAMERPSGERRQLQNPNTSRTNVRVNETDKTADTRRQITQLMNSSDAESVASRA